MSVDFSYALPFIYAYLYAFIYFSFSAIRMLGYYLGCYTLLLMYINMYIFFIIVWSYFTNRLHVVNISNIIEFSNYFTDIVYLKKTQLVVNTNCMALPIGLFQLSIGISEFYLCFFYF